MLIALLLAFSHPNPQPPPDLPASVFRERREKVIKELGGCATAIAAQGAEPPGPVTEFRQDDDFFWLTGINEPKAWLLLLPKAKYRRHVLYLKPRDPELEQWTGQREAISPALKAQYGVDYIRRGDGGEALVRPAPLVTVDPAHDCLAIIAPPGDLKDERNDVKALRQAANALGLKLVYKRDLLARLRAAHGPEEIALMEQAIKATLAGHEAAARATVSGVSERDVQTQMEFGFFSAGATGLSYGSIVGSGENGAVLHWGKNSRILKDGDLVVIDAAAEYGRYAADVTRTFPVSGKFTEEQAKVYRAVYQAQEDIFAAIKPGVAMIDLEEVAEGSLKRSGYLEKFIHSFGHFIGLNVHDVGNSGAPIPPGAIFTVEPGIYLPERGFGVRIEDEVLILPNGKWKLLTAGFPRKLEDVEAWVARARR
jgi:Xaa-Pro aminopeptidase